MPVGIHHKEFWYQTYKKLCYIIIFRRTEINVIKNILVDSQFSYIL